MEADIDSEQLISLVQERPVLWNKSQENYKSRAYTSKAWREICAILNQDFENLPKFVRNEYGRLVIKRWKNVKDQFIKTLKKKERNAATGKKMKKYIYHEQLSFLCNNEAHSYHKDESVKSGTSEEETDEVIVVEKACEMRKVNAIKTRAMRSAIKRKKTDLEGEIKEHSPSKEDHHLSSAKDHSSSSIKQDHNFSSSTKENPKASTKDDTPSPAKHDFPYPSTKEDRHMSFFNAIRPSLLQFTDDETLQFQSDVIKLIQSIKKARLLQHQISTQHPSSSCQANTQPHLNGQALSEQQESGQVSPAPSDCGSHDVIRLGLV